MEVAPIPVIRAAHLKPLADVSARCPLSDTDFPTQVALPANLSSKPDAFVPVHAACSFARWVALRTGNHDLGLLIGSGLRMSAFGVELRDAVLSATSLADALERFSVLADREQSNVRYRIVRSGDEVCIGSSVNGAASEDDGFGEGLRLMWPVTLIRHFTGDSWAPLTIAFQSPHEPGVQARRAFPDTRFTVARKNTALTFPAKLLYAGAGTNSAERRPAVATNGQGKPLHSPANWTFPSSLGALLQAHLDEGYPDIQLAATIAGCSVRTLQRRLHSCGLRYTDVIQHVRFNLAASVLREPEMKVIDAALAVGYGDPAHFSRAFKRVSGFTPAQYRRLNTHLDRSPHRLGASTTSQGPNHESASLADSVVGVI